MHSSAKCQRCPKWHKSKKQRQLCRQLLRLSKWKASKLKQHPKNVVDIQNDGVCLQTYEKCEQVQIKQNKIDKSNSLLICQQKWIGKPCVIMRGTHILFEQQKQKIVETASTMKLLTLYTCFLLMKQFNVDYSTQVTVPPLKLFQNQTKANLSKNEVLTIDQLFLAMILPSGGDAALTLENFFGSKLMDQDLGQLKQKCFVARMMQEGKKIGMKNLSVSDCRGVKDFNFSTPMEIVLLLQVIHQQKQLRKYLQTGHIRVQTIKNSKTQSHLYHTTNLLFSKRLFGKTGVTRDGKSCFVGYKENQNITIFFAIFECPEAQRWIILKQMIQMIQ